MRKGGEGDRGQDKGRDSWGNDQETLTGTGSARFQAVGYPSSVMTHWPFTTQHKCLGTGILIVNYGTFNSQSVEGY